MTLTYSQIPSIGLDLPKCLPCIQLIDLIGLGFGQRLCCPTACGTLLSNWLLLVVGRNDSLMFVVGRIKQYKD
jgi:hypothetical protein